MWYRESGKRFNKPHPWQEKAINLFGETYDPVKAAYLFPDGRMLDFSGNHDRVGGFPSHRREKDHREINEIMPDHEPGGIKGINRFLHMTGAARVNHNGDGWGIHVATPPTPEQASVIMRHHQRGGEFSMDAYHPDKEEMLFSEYFPSAMHHQVSGLLNKAGDLLQDVSVAKPLPKPQPVVQAPAAAPQAPAKPPMPRGIAMEYAYLIDQLVKTSDQDPIFESLVNRIRTIQQHFEN